MPLRSKVKLAARAIAGVFALVAGAAVLVYSQHESPSIPQPKRPHQIATYELLSGSTITPLNGAAPTGAPEPLTGTFTWKPLGPDFVTTDLNLKSKSFSITLVRGPENNLGSHAFNAPEISFSTLINVNEKRSVIMSAFRHGKFEGSPDCPSHLAYSDIKLYQYGVPYDAEITMLALRISPPLEGTEVPPTEIKLFVSELQEGISRIAEEWVSPRYLFESCKMDAVSNGAVPVGPFHSTTGAVFTVPKDKIWNITGVGGYINGEQPGIYVTLIALDSPTSVPKESFRELNPRSPDLVAASVINPGANSYQTFPLKVRLTSGSYALIFGTENFGPSSSGEAALQLVSPVASSSIGSRIFASDSNPGWVSVSDFSMNLSDVVITVSGTSVATNGLPIWLYGIFGAVVFSSIYFLFNRETSSSGLPPIPPTKT